MKKGIKPFTLFLFIFIIIYLVIGTKIFVVNSNNTHQWYKKTEELEPKWTGVITLWDIPYVETGTISNAHWLNTRVEKFERENPGVFIEVRRLTPQRAQMYFSGNPDKDILPDIISIPIYEDFVPSSFYEELRPYFQDEELNRILPLAQRPIIKNDTMKGVPVMMGTYALFFNNDMLQEQEIVIEGTNIDFATLDRIVKKLSYVEKENRDEIQYYGFGSYNSIYSKPIVSMVYNQSGKIKEDNGYKYLYSWINERGLLPENIGDLDSSNANRLFVDEKRIGVFLGNTRTLYRAREAQAQGKGFELRIYAMPMEGKDGLFQDQIVSYGLIKKEDEIKKDYCIAFLKSLLSDEAQMELNKIGMFPIIKDIGSIYDDDPEMQMLEQNLAKFIYSPSENFWRIYEHEIIDILKPKFEDNPDISY